MRFTISRDEFLKALRLVSKPVPVKAYIASLVFIKLVLDDRGLNLVGSGETIAISTLIPFSKDNKEIIRNHSNGAILVQGKYLVDIISKLSGQEINFEVLDNSVVEITDERSSFQLNSAQVEEYPEYDFNEAGIEFKINSKDLALLVEQTSFAAAKRENRPMLTALNITGEGNQITAVALDSARYASKKITINGEANFIANISAKNINEIVRTIEDNQEVTVVVINEKKMMFKFGDTVIASNLLNGEYPNVKNIVPKNFNYSLEVNAQEFLSAIDRVSLLSNEKSTVRLIMSSDEVQVLSTTSEVGSANEKINNFQFNGDRLEILFNSGFVIDAIRALKSDDVVLEFIAEMKPFVIKNPKDENITQLITPVRA